MLSAHKQMWLRAVIWAIVALQSPAFAQEAWFPYQVEVWQRPFDMDSPRQEADYVPLERAAKKWKICVCFPHMKDAYWLAANYGVAAEARRLGVHMDLKEAGGYENLETQMSQLSECVAEGADGVILGAISYTGLDSLIATIADRGIPVIDNINGVSSDRIAAKSLVSYADMGFKAGEYLARLHPPGGNVARVAWFPGPAEAGWVQAGDSGFRKAVAAGAIEIVSARYGDTGKTTQAKLLRDILDQHSDLDYVVGTAITAEAAVSILRKRGLSKRTGILAYYLTPGVFRGIRRGRILAAPTDSAVIQGRIAVDQLVRILEGKDVLRHVGPRIEVIDRDNIDALLPNASLSPSGFHATFTVN